MLLFDATHTSHTRTQTGIQRVTRSLFAELTKLSGTTGVCHDPHLRAWRPLDAGELDHLQPGQKVTGSRGAKWPLHRRLTGPTRRLFGAKPAPPRGDALVCPELFSAQTGAGLPQLLAAVRGPRIAIFHDAIGLQLPELTPAGTVARLPGYLRELLLFDGVAAVSEASAASLRDYWRWLGVSAVPPVLAIPNGINPLQAGAAEEAGPGPQRVLCVGTVEGRKNHLVLLEACETLWARGLTFEVHLLGLARPDTASRALEKIASLQRAGRPLRYDGPVTDAEISRAYGACAFTVYPSLAEGFGLPVIESLARGKPCICSAQGALGEIALGGGCLTLETVDPASLAEAIARLLTSPAELATLAATARARRFKSWADYARDLTGWMQTLSRRS